MIKIGAPIQPKRGRATPILAYRAAIHMALQYRGCRFNCGRRLQQIKDLSREGGAEKSGSVFWRCRRIRKRQHLEPLKKYFLIASKPPAQFPRRIFSSAALAMKAERVNPCAAASSSIACSVPASSEMFAVTKKKKKK